MTKSHTIKYVGFVNGKYIPDNHSYIKSKIGETNYHFELFDTLMIASEKQI